MNNRAASSVVSACSIAVIHPADGGVYYLRTAHPRGKPRSICGQIINRLRGILKIK